MGGSSECLQNTPLFQHLVDGLAFLQDNSVENRANKRSELHLPRYSNPFNDLICSFQTSLVLYSRRASDKKSSQISVNSDHCSHSSISSSISSLKIHTMYIGGFLLSYCFQGINFCLSKVPSINLRHEPCIPLS